MALPVELPIAQDSRAVDANLTRYSVELKTKILTRGSATHIYFDQAKAIRE